MSTGTENGRKVAPWVGPWLVKLFAIFAGMAVAGVVAVGLLAHLAHERECEAYAESWAEYQAKYFGNEVSPSEQWAFQELC